MVYHKLFLLMPSLIIDDTVVERYGGEGVGYHHDSKHGLVKGHCYVTATSLRYAPAAE